MAPLDTRRTGVQDGLNALRRARFGLRNVVGRYPRWGLPLFRIAKGRGGGAEAVGKHTKIVIEGYPRCANTFALVAFQQAQPRNIAIAHHLHISAQILAGVSRGLPVILLVRSPLEAIPSLMLRDPVVTPRFAFRYYVDFYSRVRSVMDGTVVASFAAVTTDFERVMIEVNRRYQSSFVPFKHTQENVAECFAEIDRVDRLKFGAGREVVISGVSRPASDRSPATRHLAENLEGLVAQSLFSDAMALYQEVRQRSVF